jgi:high-affinity iron transporter
MSGDHRSAGTERATAGRVMIIGVLAIAVLAVLVAGLRSGTPPGPADPGSERITVGNDRCAPELGAARSGRSVYRVTNAGPSPEEVTVLDGDHRYAYAALEMIAPGTTARFVVILPPGTVSWSCESDDGNLGYSDPVTVRGPAVAGVHRWMPVTYPELSNAVTRYRRSVSAGLRLLATDTGRLSTAVRDHDRAAARARWLIAHLDYERLGAAYGTFGADADAIDGRPDGLPRGTADSEFTGFHRVEYLLWHHGSGQQLITAVSRLDHDVQDLVRDFPRQLTAPNDVALRAHEILEDTLQFELTTATDQGSHSNLATAMANLDGTRLTLDALAPLLSRHDPGLLRTARSGLSGLERTLTRYRRGDGSWSPVQSLTRRQREEIDGRLASVLEVLASIPTELEILTTHDDG